MKRSVRMYTSRYLLHEDGCH